MIDNAIVNIHCLQVLLLVAVLMVQLDYGVTKALDQLMMEWLYTARAINGSHSVMIATPVILVD